MNKKDIVKLLDKEVGLFIETEEEDSDGELYLSEIEFKDAGEVLAELKRLRDEAEEWKEELKGIVEGDERFTVWKDISQVIVDKQINVPSRLIILDGSNIFTHCYFQEQSQEENNG